MPDEKDEFALLNETGLAPREPQGFAPAEMVACEACLRANPPTRTNCLYCGAELPVTEASLALRRPTLRPLEEWEQGFNVVLLLGGAGEATESKLADAAMLLRLETKLLRQIIDARRFLPLARTASRDDATLIEQRLVALGWTVEIVVDERLGAETFAPKRIRKIELGEDALTGLTGAGDEGQRMAWSEIILLVSGRIFTKRVEVDERRSTLGTSSKVDERAMFADEAVLDIYSGGDSRSGNHWRIAGERFDYSCLGEQKSLLARDNFVKLTGVLSARARMASHDDDYLNVRQLLNGAWPLAERTQSGGLRRERVGKFNTEAVTSATNEMQFTRYSRLRHYLELRRQAHT